MGNSLVSESNSKGRHIQYAGEHRTNVCGCMSAQSCLGRPCEHSLWAYPGLSVLLGAVQGAWRLLSFLPAANSFWPLWRPDVPGVWHTWPCLHDVKCYVKYMDYGTGSCCVGVNLIREILLDGCVSLVEMSTVCKVRWTAIGRCILLLMAEENWRFSRTGAQVQTKDIWDREMSPGCRNKVVLCS